MNDINSNFCFKFVDQDQVFKNVKMLDGNKASQKNDITIKMIKKTLISYFIFYISYHLLHLIFYLTLSFQVNLKKLISHPFIKR